MLESTKRYNYAIRWNFKACQVWDWTKQVIVNDRYAKRWNFETCKVWYWTEQAIVNYSPFESISYNLTSGRNDKVIKLITLR